MEKGSISKVKVLILPGIGNSGPEHWQSLWEASNPSFRRVEQRDWDAPVCSEWIASLEKATAESAPPVSNSGPETVLVAHSLACLLVAHWAAGTNLRIRGALLVATAGSAPPVPDPEGANFPVEAIGFGPVPQKALPFRTIVVGGALPAVASTNDPYGSMDHASRCASIWGSDLVVIEGAGHINSASGLGEWREGFALLQRLVA